MAGEFRKVSISKGVTEFASPRGKDMFLRLENAHKVIADLNWRNLSRQGFVEAVSKIYAELNQAHPLREGNGRSAKVFMDDLSVWSPFRFDWHAVNPEQWNQASAFSSPDLGAWDTHPNELHAVFAAVTTPRN